MPELTVYSKDLQGYTPLIDPRRLTKPTIINGINFLNDVDGPKSAFGSDFVNYYQYSDEDKIKPTPLKVGLETWYGTPTGLFRHDPITGSLIIMLSISTDEFYWPWSVAYCGGLYYFAQFGIGLWEYDPNTNTLTLITGLPVDDSEIKFVSVSYGRLLLLADNDPADILLWSALDDGRDFTPSIATGAGAQTCGLTGKRGYGIYYTDNGLIVPTDNGIMIGLYNAQSYVWVWRTLSRAVKVFSPNASCIIPDTGVVLTDKQGMFITNGDKPTPWQPIFGEYFKRNLLKNMDTTKIGCINLFYSAVLGAVFVSFAPNSREGNFTTTYVYLVAADQWGVFNRACWGFSDTLLPVTQSEVVAFMSFDGYLEYFNDLYSIAVTPVTTYSIDELIWRPEQDIEPVIVNGVYQFYSRMTNPNFDATAYQRLTVFGLYYQPYDIITNVDNLDLSDPAPDSSITTYTFYTDINFFTEGAVFSTISSYVSPTVGLNSFIEVGPYRFIQQQASDETSMIDGIIIGIKSGAAQQTFEDWLILIGTQDWISIDGMTDWGEANSEPDNFDLLYTPTNDGFNSQLQGTEQLYIVNNLGGSYTYSPQGTSAIFHRFKLSANDPSQGFNFKYMDISGILTGRMTFA